jgi:hypothetical protein
MEKTYKYYKLRYQFEFHENLPYPNDAVTVTQLTNGKNGMWYSDLEPIAVICYYQNHHAVRWLALVVR